MQTLKTVMKYLLAVLFTLAGALHFTNPDYYLKIMPPYLPWHVFLVYLSGFFEVLLGVLLVVPRFSRLAAWGLVALLIAVFPANIHMARHPELFPHMHPAALLLRLPLQAVLVAWAYWHTRPDVVTQARD